MFQRALVIFVCYLYDLGYGMDCNSGIHAHFKVDGGTFRDICGRIGLNEINGAISNNVYNDYIDIKPPFHMSADAYIVLGNSFALFIEGYQTSAASYNIILGPAGQSGNNQIRYEYGNRLGIYSYSSNPTYSETIQLPHSTSTWNNIAIYYNSYNQRLTIYQNNNYVTSITKRFSTSLRRIGAWYSGRYNARIRIKNIVITSNRYTPSSQSAFQDYIQGISSSTTYSTTYTPTNIFTTNATVNMSTNPNITIYNRTEYPSADPTLEPTKYPSGYPSISPTMNPSESPSDSPSDSPSISPTLKPDILSHGNTGSNAGNINNCVPCKTSGIQTIIPILVGIISLVIGTLMGYKGSSKIALKSNTILPVSHVNNNHHSDQTQTMFAEGNEPQSSTPQ